MSVIKWSEVLFLASFKSAVYSCWVVSRPLENYASPLCPRISVLSSVMQRKQGAVWKTAPKMNYLRISWWVDSRQIADKWRYCMHAVWCMGQYQQYYSVCYFYFVYSFLLITVGKTVYLRLSSMFLNKSKCLNLFQWTNVRVNLCFFFCYVTESCDLM